MDEKTQQVIALQAEIKADEDEVKNLRAEAAEHDKAAGAARLKASELRRGLEAKRALLVAARAGVMIASNEQAAAQARSLAEQGLAEIVAKKAELDAAIAEAKAAAEKANKAAEAKPPFPKLEE